MSMILVHNSQFWSFLDVLHNSNQCFSMSINNGQHKLTWNTYIKSNIISNDNQIIQLFHQSFFTSIQLFSPSLTFSIIGISRGLALIKLISIKRSITHFLCERNISFFEFITLMPNKYLCTLNYWFEIQSGGKILVCQFLCYNFFQL